MFSVGTAPIKAMNLIEATYQSMMNAIKGIINNCVQEKIDVDKLSPIDALNFLHQLKNDIK